MTTDSGSPPPTPGPTREQVHGALYQAYIDHTVKPSSLTVGDMVHLTDAVMALLSTRPATVLWEGRTVPASTTCGEDSSVVQPGCLSAPSGTRVRIVTEAQP